MTRRTRLLAALAAVVLGTLAVPALSAVFSRQWEARLERERGPRTPPGSKVWAHRGLRQNGAPENSHAAVVAAAAAGFRGVELDVWYSSEAGLRVSHNRTKGALALELPRLEALVAREPELSYYWLDWKGLSPEVARAAGPLLSQALGKDGLAARCVVESRDAEALAELRRFVPELRLALHLGPWELPRWTPLWGLALRDVHRHGIDALSVAAAHVDAELRRRTEPLWLLTYTVNDASRLDELLALGVDVVLTDSLPPGGP